MQRGFSLIELLIVLTIVTILTGISVFYLSAHQRLYKPDEQSLKILDILQEARQRSLTQRETMRVEIDLTDNIVRLIEENQPDTVNDDKKIKELVLLAPSDVKINSRPPDITTSPVEPTPVPIAQFKQSIYTPSYNHSVCTIRFLRNGSVVNEGTDTIGTNAVTTGLTLYIWSPKVNTTDQSEIARAVTILGISGAVRLWEYNRFSSEDNKWKDSRHFGTFGGQN